MDIVERREYGGTWWGRARDGTWFRWSATANGWEGPLTRPWPEPPPHPDEDALVARAMAAAGPPDVPPPTNRLDAWWIRHFPPFSIRRLLFGLAVLPLMAGLQELLWMAMGRDPSLPRYIFVCVAGAVLLATAWLPGMRGLAEELQASGALGARSSWPWRRRPDAPAPAPLPPFRRSRKQDFLVALPFTFVMMLVISATVTGLGVTFSPAALLTIAVSAVLSALLIAFRASVWSIVLVSIAAGVLGGFAVVMLSMMSFSDPGLGEFLVGWALGAVTAFVFLYPMWRTVRNLEARGFRFPMWIVMGGNVLLVAGGALVFLAEQ